MSLEYSLDTINAIDEKIKTTKTKLKKETINKKEQSKSTKYKLKCLDILITHFNRKKILERLKKL